MKTCCIAFAMLVASLAAGQETPKAPAKGTDQQPPVKLSVLNVCSLSEADAKLMLATLARIPAHPGFLPDFEMTRGLSMVEGSRSRWVRERHEFPAPSTFASAQYTVTVDGSAITEMAMLRFRQDKDLVQISIEDSVTAGRVEEVLASDTPATRMRLERSGGTSIVLARCPAQDQSTQAATFEAASLVMREYRQAFHAKDALAVELARPDLRGAGGGGAAPAKR